MDPAYRVALRGRPARKIRIWVAIRIPIPRGVEVVKVAVMGEEGERELKGLRMWLSNGKAIGALNCQGKTHKVKMMGMFSRITDHRTVD